MSGYTWMSVGGSIAIPVLVSESVVVERMLASAERYRILSNVQARELSQTVDVDDDDVEGPLFV